MLYRRVRQYWWLMALAGIFCGLFLFVAAPAHYTTYENAVLMRRVLSLLLGIVYFVVMALLDLSPLFIIMVFVIFVGCGVGIRQLWLQRRWPSLIVLAIAIGVNFTFVAVPGFALSARVGEPVSPCRYSYDADVILRIERYPVDVRLDYGEQAFFLISYDQGQNWQQLFAAYAVNPVYLERENITRVDENGIRIIFERQVASDQNELVAYESFDRGVTWTRVNND